MSLASDTDVCPGDEIHHDHDEYESVENRQDTVIFNIPKHCNDSNLTL